MPSKTLKVISISSVNNIDIPDDLDSLSRVQLQSLAKKYGIAANAKSETIKRNLKKFSLKSKLSHVTRLDTQLPRDIQDLVFDKVYTMANPEIEDKIKKILDVTIYPGDDFIVYNYSKIREKLKIKHNVNQKDLDEKVMRFRHKHVRLGVVHYYYEIQDIIEYFTEDMNLERDDFDVYFRKLYNIEKPLRKAINDYNRSAEILKNHFGSYLRPDYVDEVNDFLKKFREIAKKDRKFGKIPLLNYGTIHNIGASKVSRKTRSLSPFRSKSSVFKKTRSRKTRSL